jgi:6-phosphofructo-2-kinase / fructose-2,6-biphosphatase 3
MITQQELQALNDFEARIKEYEKVYQPLTDGKSNRHLHFIQLVNMVTGRGYMDINRISGYIPGKMVFFLMQVSVINLISSYVFDIQYATGSQK